MAFYDLPSSIELNERLMAEFLIVSEDIRESTYNLHQKYLYGLACLEAFLCYRKSHKLTISNQLLKNLIENFIIESYDFQTENLDPFKGKYILLDFY